MLIERTERGLKIRTPAKLNLFLDVLGKRTDGYHQIDTIMCPVGLLDELEAEPTDTSRIEFSVASPTKQQPVASLSGSAPGRSTSAIEEDPAWRIPSGDENLVVRALRATERALASVGTAEPSIPLRGCRVRLTKRIPAAAGLGGGSSDAAAAIVAGMIMWGRWDRPLAVDIASRLGSDIPLFLGDERNGIGLARATQRGEHVEMLSGRPPLCFVISHPPVGSSTAEVYKLWQPRHQIRSSTKMLALLHGSTIVDTADMTPNPDARQHALPEPLRQAIEHELFNALQPPASQLTDWIERQLNAYAQLGKPMAMMSGSGSACFTLVRDLDEGRQIVDKMIELGMPRAYAVPAWYAASLETQLERITNNQLPVSQSKV